jgi:hypothetical protein
VTIYRVLSPVIIKGVVHKAGDLIQVHLPSVADKYAFLERTDIETPTECCYWCVRKGLPGNEFWLNFRNRYICKVCFAPETFPKDISRVVYDEYTIRTVDGTFLDEGERI